MNGTGAGLAGRETEEQLLEALLDRAVNGDAQTVLVAGDPGIGKTALVRTVTAGRDDVLTLSGTCSGRIRAQRCAVIVAGDDGQPRRAATALAVGAGPRTPAELAAVLGSGDAETAAALDEAAGLLSARQDGTFWSQHPLGAEVIESGLALARDLAAEPIVSALETLARRARVAVGAANRVELAGLAERSPRG